MANRFTRWAPTAYVPLPIDYYQSALAYKEQKTAAALEKINAIIAGYGAIDPLSPDAQALYDETTEKLRGDLGAIVKQDLTTPAANRAVNKVLSDPTIVDGYDKVMTDALYGAEAKKNLNEYLKKNPKVNAAEYLSRFDQLGTEKGISANFDPNRFRNMPVLSDYYDINKRIEEGIAKLHSDSVAYKKIAEPYMLEGKETALTKQKVREYVISQIQNDPQVQEQMKRKLRYSGYLADPYDIDNGITKMGENYRQGFQETKQELQDGLTKLYGKSTPAELDALRKGKDDASKKFRKAEREILTGIESLTPYVKKNTDPNAPVEFLDPTELAGKVEADQLKYGFDQFAWNESMTGEEYSPDYLARLRARLSFDNSRRLHDLKMKDVMDLLKPVSISYDTRETDVVTPDKWADYWKKQLPELNKVVLSPNGDFTEANYKNELVEVNKGVFYLPSDVDITASTGTGFTSGGGGATPTLKYHIKPGAKPVDKATGTKKLFEEGTKQIKDFLDTNLVGADFDLNTEVGRKKAVQAITAFQQSTESMYGPIYTNLSSNKKEVKTRIRANLNNSAIYALNSDREMVRVDDEDAIKESIRKELDNTNSSVGMRPVSKLGKAFRVVSVGNKNYYIEDTPLAQNYAAPANGLVKAMMTKGEPVRAIGSDLFLKFMTADGSLESLVIAQGASPQAQADYKFTYDTNINKIMTEGNVSRETAEAAIRKQAQSHGGALSVKVGNKTVPIDVPIMKHTAKDGTTQYYAWGDVGNYRVANGREVINNVIQNSMSVRTNPEAALDFSPVLRAATKELMILDDDELPE
jgi:hypothetical protein